MNSNEKNNEEMWERIEQRIAKIMQKDKIPGLSVAVVKDQEIIYSKNFGVRNLAKNQPVTHNTLFGIGSCTKVFTCLAIMQLAEKGLLSINDPVKKYLPFKIGIEDKPVQIRHLMSHSSGIPNLGSATVLILRHAPLFETWIPFATKEDMYLLVNGAQEEIVDEPGERYFYLNTGYTLLGEIIETVSGLSYEDYIEENILKPLKMSRSTFLQEKFDKDEDRMTAYIQEKDKPIEKNHPFDQLIYAAGGLLSSANEMANFLAMMLNEGRYENSQIISTESLEEMFSIQIDVPPNFYGRNGYAFGLGISEDFLGKKLIGHSGSTGMSSAYFCFIPELNCGVVTMANAGNIPGSLVGHSILSSLMGKDHEETVPFFQIQAKMEQFSGEYVNYKGINKVKIYIENGLLFYESKFGETLNKVALIPEDAKLADNRFYIYSFGYKTPVTFEIKENNEIDLFIERNCFHKIK
ncbi:MAG: serine hydrolase [Asgard group archaeon]|nr:serine hydrolase [Asgard group archaeon]